MSTETRNSTYKVSRLMDFTKKPIVLLPSCTVPISARDEKTRFKKSFPPTVNKRLFVKQVIYRKR